MATNRMDAEEVLQEIERAGHEKVRVGGFDVDGVLRGKYMSREKLASSIFKGFGFCDVIFGWDSADRLYDNVAFTGWHTGYPDLLAKIELDTLRRVPWEKGLPFFICDFYKQDQSPLPISPRQVLRRVVERARGMGYEPVFATEYEFFLFRESPASIREKGYRGLTPLDPGMFGYSVYRASSAAPLMHQLMDDLLAYDCPLEALHCETGPGVYEAAVQYEAAVESADRAALVKEATKEIARRHDLVACFMAKWNADLPGCGGHVHQSLWDKGREKNLFHDPAAKDGASTVMRQYVAGQLALLPELTALFAPTINSYKRFQAGTWAPLNATWGYENRTCALRAITGPSPKAVRIEHRVPGADLNPFLAYAASLAAGLHGIEKGLEPPPPVAGNAYAQGADAAPLPRSLSEATALLRESAAAKEYLGEEFVDHFCRTREWEVRESRRAVTDWELARYFETA